MTSVFAKSLVGSVAGLALIGAVMTAPAEARDGGAVAAGVIGGLALGAIAGSAAANANGYDPGYAPAYAAPRAYYRGGGCYYQRQAVYDEDGYVAGHRRVRVCE